MVVAAEGATFQDVAHFVKGVAPGDGIFTTWSYRAGAGRAEAFLLNPQPLPARTAQEWGVVAEIVPNGKALSRAQELAELYLKAPEVTRRNTRVHFIQPLKERIVKEVGYGLSLEGSSAVDLVKSIQAKSEPVVAWQLVAHHREHDFPVGLRPRDRRRNGPRPIPPLLSGWRTGGHACPDSGRSSFYGSKPGREV